jgi:hypothetical protein
MDIICGCLVIKIVVKKEWDVSNKNMIISESKRYGGKQDMYVIITVQNMLIIDSVNFIKYK